MVWVKKKTINKYILPQGTVDLVYTKPESIPDVASAWTLQ